MWRNFGGDSQFERYCQEQGPGLRLFATFTALTEHHQKAWHQWPEEHRHPTSAAVGRFATEFADRIRFHEWVQWLIDRQLAVASGHVAIVQDLPVGFDPDGADAWQWQDLIASGVRVGAPPDAYSADGQDWGLPPFIPHKLAEAHYEPFIETLRTTLRHSGGLRIDHVMGLFRLFWIPFGLRASEGTYVSYPADDLLGIVALESQRAKAFVVGEDLGTVEPGVRERLAANGILSYRVAWFEEDPPPKYPMLALAAMTTHDLPTVAGVWDGTDPDAHKLQERLKELTGFSSETSVDEVTLRAYERLAASPCLIVTAALDDALGVQQRPNVPNTMERPNWCLPLPKRLDELEQDPQVIAVAGTLMKELVER
jgi:4-alpha-glucanotransferase